MEENTSNGSSGTPNSSASGGDQGKQTVAYETHQKLLSEKKKLAEKHQATEAQLNELLAAQEAAKNQELEKQSEYQKLWEASKQENEKLKNERDAYQKNIMDAHKINAFSEKLPGKIANSKYYDFVPLDQIVVDPESGRVDEASVQSVVDSFVKEHSGLLVKGKSPGLPNDAPDSTKGPQGYLDELRKCNTQAEYDAVRRKYGKHEGP